MDCLSVGIDIGSTCTKTVVLDNAGEIKHKFLQPTGWSSAQTANSVDDLLKRNNIQTNKIISTGYGRNLVTYAPKKVTEITCHAKGACHIFKSNDITVIDIGGQDTKIIKIENGIVTDFLMNDKCSAGTGRFLEIMSNTLEVTPDELCKLASQGENTKISSMCTVFAETEVISLIGKGEKRENIAFAVLNSIVEKVVSQATKLLPKDGLVCLTGGLCDFDDFIIFLEKALSRRIITNSDARYAGAVGAAIMAQKL